MLAHSLIRMERTEIARGLCLLLAKNLRCIAMTPAYQFTGWCLYLNASKVAKYVS